METKDWTIVVKVEGQPAGGYTLTLPADRGTEFSEAHLEFLRSWGQVELVTQDD